MSARSHVLLGFLAVGAIVSLFAQRRCGAPTPVTVKTLWSDRDPWVDRKVEVVGVVKVFGAGTPDEHYFLEQGGFRVGLRGAARPEPKSLLERHVVARGMFVFTPQFGAYLESPSLEPRSN